MNSWTGMGNLGADPVLKQTASGISVCTFNLAVDGRRGHTNWVPVVVFGRAAELQAQYLQEGSKVVVRGELNVRSYKDRNGVSRIGAEVRAEEVQWVSGIRKQEVVLN